ncbi:MAG TPA: histidinol-phosphatase HisJ family protein [Candidatus Limnocylindrales bacterium]|nr:histidinol-phosphatase HisJ family protein [Candidatus Limnocylindrales bacterium]
MSAATAEPSTLLPSPLPVDSHLHTDLSPDSDVPIDVYCALAVERGIPEIAITDQVDFDPRDPAYDYVDFATRERTVREAAERWAPHGLAVRFGAELTYNRRWEADVRDHLRTHRYDYTIGSVHDWPESPYRNPDRGRWIAETPLDEVLAPYFDEVVGAARSGLFDTIGHVDVVKRYLHPHVAATALAGAPELFEAALRSVVESGAALEINTSGLRQDVGETYPAAWVVGIYRELGGRRVTVGSDAHRRKQFAFRLGEGYAIAVQARLDEVSFRRGGGRVTIPLGRAVAAG